MSLPHGRLLSIDEVAEYLKLSRATLYNQKQTGSEPGSLGFNIGNRVRFRAEDIEAWLERLVVVSK
jgi:excisionase family DNA binding protein